MGKGSCSASCKGYGTGSRRRRGMLGGRLELGDDQQ
jgi:hypothetical protein